MKRWHSNHLMGRCFVVLALSLGLCAALVFALFVVKSTGISRFWGLLFGLAALFLAWIAYRWIYRPYREGEKMLQLFAAGYTMQSVQQLNPPYSPQMKEAMEHLLDLLNTSGLIHATKKQAEYLALQNQINPHFLYNTLEGIRGEALVAGLDSVAEMTETLATFFRYTISNVEQLVTLEDELNNVENYCKIQQYRFGDRVQLEVRIEEEDRPAALRYRLPKLTLQPIVENAIIHGIERKAERGTIRIGVYTTQNRLLINVADDGIGMQSERVNELNRRLDTLSFDYIDPDRNPKGGIAILNVSNRLRLLFGEEYGIRIYSTPGFGTDVELSVPLDAGSV